MQGCARRVADFLGFEPTAEQWPTILECTSFPWMKAHQEKFEAGRIGEVPVLKSGAMIRKRNVGAAKEEGVTDAIAAAIGTAGREMVGDEAALACCYEGGPLPE